MQRQIREGDEAGFHNCQTEINHLSLSVSFDKCEVAQEDIRHAECFHAVMSVFSRKANHRARRQRILMRI